MPPPQTNDNVTFLKLASGQNPLPDMWITRFIECFSLIPYQEKMPDG